MRGRKPTPTSRQIAAGDPRKIGKRKLLEKLENEPKATRGLPECPAHLKGLARDAWHFWAEELMAMEQDHRPDAMMLEGACVNYARAVKADGIIERVGVTVEISEIDKDSGERFILKISTHPAVGVSNAAWRQTRAFCSEFGMSPVARTRLATERRTDGKDLMSILTQERKPRATTVQ